MSLIKRPPILDSTGQKIASAIRSSSQNILTIRDNSAYHNSIFRGKALGNEITSTQKQAIKNGTFEDLFIGDYWTINGINWRIAHFNYWLGTGDDNNICTSNHIVIVPDTNLATAKMNSSNSTVGGYLGSGLYTGINLDETENIGLSTAKTTFVNTFGQEHLLKHRELFSNTVTSGVVSGVVWVDSIVDLMSERMVYGTSVWGKSGYEAGIDKTILALFDLNPEFIQKQRSWYWLRSVYSAAVFCNVSNYGFAGYSGASGSSGVRPAAAIYFDDI